MHSQPKVIIIAIIIIIVETSAMAIWGLLCLGFCKCSNHHRLSATSWSHNHGCVPSQHRFIQLHYLVSLQSEVDAHQQCN